MSLLEQSELTENVFKEIMKTLDNYSQTTPINMLDVLTTTSMIVRFVIETNFPKDKWLMSFDLYAKAIREQLETSNYVKDIKT